MRLPILILLATALAAADPPSHRIAMARPYTQANAYACGPASAKMLLDHYGPDVAFADVASVARLTSNGTAVGDVVRAGQFSWLSAAQGRTGAVAPLAGYPQRPLGLAVLAHAQAGSWLPQVKTLISQDIPVLMLMQFTAASPGGHYRIAMGYDDASQTMWFADPWGREFKGEQDADGFQPFSYQDVETCWTYTGYGTALPHWGAIYVPWTVELSAMRGRRSTTLTAVTTYPCPAPFAAAQFPASQVRAVLEVPSGWTLTGAATVGIGALPAGGRATTTWTLAPGPTPAVFTVRASGLVSGSLPATWAYDGTAGTGQEFPAYSYRDEIGGSASLVLGSDG